MAKSAPRGVKPTEAGGGGGVLAGVLAATAFGLAGIVCVVLLLAAVAAGLYERMQIDTGAPAAASDVDTTDSKAEGFIAMPAGRHPSQPAGSAVMPPVPNDPWRRAHSRMQVATSLREAASGVLEVEADIRKARRRDKFLAALYHNERDRMATSVVRKELALVFLLAVGGAIAVWGLR